MPLKMRELTKLTDTPKSTILYYIKEGLLPEPKKIKPNVHLYDDDFVERIRFIKYLQTHFNASIGQIRELLRRRDFDFSRGFEAVLETLDLLMAPPSPAIHSAEAVCEMLGIDEKRLNRYLEMGAVFEREGGFSDKEVEILSILIELERLDESETLLKTYLRHAKETAERETAFAERLLSEGGDRNAVVKALFDATLILKPYLFNMHLVHTYQKRKDER